MKKMLFYFLKNGLRLSTFSLNPIGGALEIMKNGNSPIKRHEDKGFYVPLSSKIDETKQIAISDAGQGLPSTNGECTSMAKIKYNETKELRNKEMKND